jgi:D-glycero-D-manno-heptose 1,7-bisphosphate phosphatase
MKAVIMAGGKGTRLRPLTKDEIPKPLAPICGKPILQWQIQCLKRGGVRDICFAVGHLGEKIREYFGESYVYHHETEPLGSAGALLLIRDFYGDEDFLLVFGDTVFDIDIQRMARFHKAKRSKATLFVHPNAHPFDSDLVVLDTDNRVMAFDSKNNPRNGWYHNRVNAGLYILSPTVIPEVVPDTGGKLDLEKGLLTELIRQGCVYGYRSAEYVKDAGTVERVTQVERDIRNGIVTAKNLSNKQKAIFLDRDGTLNRDMDSAISVDTFELLPGAAEAVRRVNESGYLAIVVTNQPMIAKGFITWAGLDAIHAKMETLLGREGAYLDAIYYCPHHPHKGFEGEVPELKTDCDCRKPKPGMLLRAAGDWNIDLSASYMLGDGESDMLAARAAGVCGMKLGNGKNLLDAVKELLRK